jgi:hypothetical protein
MSEGNEPPGGAERPQGSPPPNDTPGPGAAGRSVSDRLRPIVIGAIVVAAVVVIVLTWSNGSTPTTASGIEANVLNQVQGSASGDFHDPSVVTMSCDTPATFKTGDTFTCKGYGASSTQVKGVYRATVTVQPSGTVSWAGTWTPSP